MIFINGIGMRLYYHLNDGTIKSYPYIRGATRDKTYMGNRIKKWEIDVINITINGKKYIITPEMVGLGPYDKTFSKVCPIVSQIYDTDLFSGKFYKNVGKNTPFYFDFLNFKEQIVVNNF